MIGLKRQITDGREFAKYFPEPRRETEIKDRNGTLPVTISTIKDVIRNYSWQAAKFAQLLVQPSLADTCDAIWRWCYDVHLAEFVIRFKRLVIYTHISSFERLMGHSFLCKAQLKPSFSEAFPEQGEEVHSCTRLEG